MGHKTYAPRESWFYKGMKAVVEATHLSSSSHPFLAPDAAERFGIGSSMVAAMRFWVQVTGLVEEHHTADGQCMPVLTPFGSLVWKHDRSLEQSATLCWMHAHVVCHKTLAPTWYWLYHHGPTTSFSVSACLPVLWHWAVRQFAAQSIRQDALRRDLVH